MKNRYTIPGFFEEAEIKGNEIKEPGFFGKTLFIIKDNEIREPGFFGKTVLVIKNGNIKRPGFLGETLYYLDKNGAVKERGFFGTTVGAFPVFDGMGPREYGQREETEIKSKTSKIDIEEIHAHVEKEMSLKEYAENLEIEQGYVADVTNVRAGVKTISVPKKYKKFNSVAPAISVETIKIHENVLSILNHNIHCSKAFVVDENNPVYCSENGVLYSKDKKILLRMPSCLDINSYLIPNSVSTIEKNAFWGVQMQGIIIPNSVKKICSNAFGLCKGFKSITIPKSVEIIEKDAFMCNKRLVIYTEWEELPKEWDINIGEIKDIKFGVKIDVK